MTTNDKQPEALPGGLANPAFLDRLHELAARYAYLGLAADLPHLTLADLFGLYLFLAKLEGTA